MSLRRARSPEKLVEWVRANFAPSQKKYWKCKFYKHFANRNARPRKTRASTEDDDPCLEEFRVCFKLGVRNKGQKRKIIDNAVRHLERVFSESAAAADAEASAPDHDVAVLGAAARSNATPPPDGASEETPCKRQRTSRGPTGGSAISMPDLGRSDNASATGTPARDGHNSPHSLGDSIHPVGASPFSPGRITSAQGLRLAQSARSSPLSRCAENIDSALSVAAQRRRVYSHAARAEEARLLAGTESPVSPLTRRLYEHLKAGRARPDSVDYMPKYTDAKNNMKNKDYSSIDTLRRHAREDKLGPRSFSSSTKVSSTSFE